MKKFLCEDLPKETIMTLIGKLPKRVQQGMAKDCGYPNSTTPAFDVAFNGHVTGVAFSIKLDTYEKNNRS